jgi:cytochrome c553
MAPQLLPFTIVSIRPLLRSLSVALVGGSLAVASGVAGAQAAAGNADRAKSKVSMCIGCHGIATYRTAYPEVYHVPLIAGQNVGYLINALKAYRSGERSHPTMRAIAANLTDDDMADLAAYYGNRKK